METSCIVDETEVLTSPKPLFRISSYENALSCLIDKYIWFSRPDKWKDPYEQFFYNATYDGLPFGLKDRCFIACFSPVRTAEAQWFMYGDGATNCLRFDYNKSTLHSVLVDFCSTHKCRAYIESVHYDTTRKIQGYKPSSINSKPYKSWGEADWVQLLALKRNAYEYENEVRIILVFDEKPKDSENGVMLHYTCASTELINKIQLSPTFSNSRATQWLLETVFHFTPRLDKIGRMQRTITQSQLYKQITPKKY